MSEILTHPADAPEFAGQRALFRTAAAAIVITLVIVSAGFGMVVNFTLGGVPLMGNRVLVAGIPAPTLVTYCATPLVIALSVLHGRTRLAAAARWTPPPDHPEVRIDGSDREQLIRAVGAGLFATDSILLAFGLALAVAYHLTASAGILACIGLTALAVLVGYPSAGRIRAAYDRAARLRAGARD